MNTHRRHQDEGFTLIELLIVMSVMLILMTMIIPQVLKVTKSANQTSAVQSLRAIGSAETQYATSYSERGFSCSIATLGGVPGAAAPTPELAQVLDNSLSTGTKSGYTFNITNCTKVTVNNHDNFTGYQATAVPNSVGRTGDWGYCMDENNIIKVDRKGGTNCTDSLQ